MRKIYVFVIIVLLNVPIAASLVWDSLAQAEAAFDLNRFLISSPDPRRHVFDEARLLKYSSENMEESLRVFREAYGVEMVIVTVPDLQGRDILDVATSMFTRWGIAKDTGGQGVLIILAREEKLIKVEVGLGAEGVFTDLFCGYIERKQLKPYFENGQVDFGLAATMEEFIGRAEGRLTDDQIREKMDGPLSAGAGVTKDVKIGGIKSAEGLPAVDQGPFVAQATPELLYAVWIKQLGECVTDPNLTMYTEGSRVRGQFSAKMSREQCLGMRAMFDRPHEIKVAGDFAVLFFPGNGKAGPVFMVQSPAGWQLDMVSTAKWVRYGLNNEWYLGGTAHPYYFAFHDGELASRVNDRDFYDDYGLFSQIKNHVGDDIGMLQEDVRQGGDNFEKTLALAEIFFDLGLAQEAVPLLQKSVELNAQDPRPYRYLGLLNRDLFVSTKTALKYLEKYTALAPADPWGYHYIAVAYGREGGRGGLENFKKAAEWMEKYAEKNNDKVYGYGKVGYFYYLAQDYNRSRQWFEKLRDLDPDNQYADKMINQIDEKLGGK